MFIGLGLSVDKVSKHLKHQFGGKNNYYEGR